MDLAFHPSGQWLAAAHMSSLTTLWPLARDYPRILYSAREGGHMYTRGVVFAPDSSWIASTGGESVLRRWPLTPSGGKAQTVKLANRARALAVDPTGRHCLAGTDAGVELVSFPEGGARELPGFGYIVMAVAFSHNGRLAAAGGGWTDSSVADRFVRVYDLEEGTFRDRRTDNQVVWLDFLPDNRLLFVSGPLEGEKKLYRWDSGRDEAEVLEEQIATGGFVRFDLSRDGHRLVVADDRGTFLHDLRDGSVRSLAPDLRDPRFDAGGKIVVGHPRGTHVVRILPLDATPPHDLAGHEAAVTEAILSPDGQWSPLSLRTELSASGRCRISRSRRSTRFPTRSGSRSCGR